MKYTVTLTQDDGSDALIINARIGGNTNQLIPGRGVDFLCEEGERRLMLDYVTAGGPVTYRIDFNNAQRFNGDHHILNQGVHGAPDIFEVYVPRKEVL